MPTTSAVPSADPSDLLFNAQKLDEVINGAAESFVDRRGVERLTLTGALRLIGFEAPVAFASGLTITRSTQTVTNGGNTYHADPASLPFTTTGTFNGAQWRLVSNVTQADLTAYAIPRTGATDLTASFKTTGAWEATGFKLDANALWSLVSTNPTWQADTGDTFSYNRTSNKWSMSVGSTERFFVTAADGPARGTDATTDDGLPRKVQVETLIAGAVGNRMQHTLTASQSTTTGSAVDFTGFPAWAKRVTVLFNGFGTSTVSDIRVQVYVDGVLKTTGYSATACYLTNGASPVTATHSTAIWVVGSGTSTLVNGACVLNLVSGNTWVSQGIVQRLNDSACQVSAGQSALSGALTGIRVDASGGSFDAGSISVLIEG